ncbi:carbohydrate kinase family protein [Anaerosporobacter faecicola]|uniref:carbohydrate kinase family protein n=1 Tax=Anaerosporobacter faecicola TaxID=2718714 RepID=UPI001439AF14|nr:carbohydrate kinase family protein [Anaerosporobacter faecicola]
MKKIVIAGLVNVETTVKVREFPIPYYPIDFTTDGVHSSVSGVGYNLAKAFQTLGDQISIATYIGEDEEGKRIERAFLEAGINTQGIIKDLNDTPQSVILYESDGRRQCYCDLKDIQDKEYTSLGMDNLLDGADLVCACNINFSRALLQEAKKRNICIATDVHVLGDINDAYNKEFMEAADILFLSDENIPVDGEDSSFQAPRNFIIKLKETYSSSIIVMGLGSKGALLYSRKKNRFYHVAAVTTRKVVNTVGAGDSLFSAYLHFYIQGVDEVEALTRAVTFASYKIGESGGAKGFLPEEELLKLCNTCNYCVTEYEI